MPTGIESLGLVLRRSRGGARGFLVADEVELIGDDDGVVVLGSRSVIERFLAGAGLLANAREFELGKLRKLAATSADVARTVSDVAEQSALYLKLTPESAKRLRDAGGLMKTKTKGVSHAMLGETGKHSLKWLQVEDGSASLLTNPAVLSGLGGLMSQVAQQSEAQELRALLLTIDEKLDDVRRDQRNAVLARMKGAAAQIEEATTLRAYGGDPMTLWSKVSGASGTILNVQEEALLALGALADKVEGKRGAGELKKLTGEIEKEVAVQLAVLARCFELYDQFRVIELDHVFATASESLEGHREGLSVARAQRKDSVLHNTGRLMARMDIAGGIAKENIILHARAARSVIGSLNATAALVDEFHTPLGIESNRESLQTTSWREAIRDPKQRRTAGKEVGQKAMVGAVTVGAVGLSVFAAASNKGGGKSSA